MEKLFLKQIATAVNSSNKESIDENVAVTSICIDTRKIVEDCIFIAIKGENFDGHDFIEKAFELGAKAVISAKETKHQNTILVSDTREALKQLAKYYRGLFNPFLVGITGSVGKTSTKEMIYSILNYKEKTLKTEGNLNNEIGLPLTLFGLDASQKNAVIELGMSNFNEINELSKICKPSASVITNIGVSHIENLGSRENILKAKLEITEGMEDDAPLILNKDDALLRTVSQSCIHPVVYYGINENADITASDIHQKGEGTHFTINYYGKKINAQIPAIGKHNVYNALAGFCIGLIVNMQPEDIVTAMKMYQNAGLRQRVEFVSGIGIIADCYNASPDSMRAALDVINNIKCNGKRYCVLGDMLELGEMAEEAHIEVGKDFARSKIEGMFCLGDMARNIKRGAVLVGMKNVQHYSDKNEIAKALAKTLKEGDTVIFKASRGMAFEEIIEKLKTLLKNKQ